MRRRWPYGRAAAEAAVAAAASFEEAARRRIALSEVHVDPLVRPVAVEPEVGAWFLEAVRTLRTTNGTGIHLTGGLSNVSFGLPNRRLLNDVFVALAIDAGVHSAIVDPIATGLARIAATDRAGRAFRLAADVLTGPTRMPMEIVIVAAGRPGLITGDMLRPRAVVVDVGINVRKGRIVGDVDAASAGPVVSAIAPVPGGVGPLTNAILLTHLMRAARNQAEGQVTLGSRSMAPTLQVESVPMGFPSDLEIARSVTPRPIVEVARAIGLREDEIELYGSFKAKVTLDGLRRVEAESPRGKYVLVTAITPTPLGEGKTTVTVGLAQGLNRIGHQAAVTIRQPSLGPVFGIKGGAAGGGYSQIIPMEDFNLHLTGDVHAIGAAHNLAAAFLDNSLHHGNPLGIDQHAILWPRVVDISDRALRHAIIGLGGREDGGQVPDLLEKR